MDTVDPIAAAWAEAWNGTDPELLGALFTEEGTYTDQAVGVTMSGREQVSGWKARTDLFIADVHAAVGAAHRADGRITVESIYSGHIKGAPAPFAVPMATILDLDGALIAADRDYYSLNVVLAQSGLPADWQPAE
jgi:hypothetical protein